MAISFIRACFTDHAENGFTPFVILYLPRTGSNFLAGKLDTHPEIICHHELFNKEGPHQALSTREGAESFDLGTADTRDTAPHDFVRQVYCRRRESKALGFKLALTDNRTAFIALLLNRSVKKILLRRNNWLAAFVSSELAEQSHQWIRFADAQTEAYGRNGDTKRISVDVRKFRTYMRKRRIYFVGLRILEYVTFQRFIPFEFSDIGDAGQIADLVEKLGCDSSVELRTRTLKQNKFPLYNRIENLVEVQRALAETPYEKFLS